MICTTAKIDGMMCSMCETHIQDAIRKAFPVRSVKASRAKAELVIVSEEPISVSALHAAIDPTGYTLGEVSSEPYQKKGLFIFKKS